MASGLPALHPMTTAYLMLKYCLVVPTFQSLDYYTLNPRKHNLQFDGMNK